MRFLLSFSALDPDHGFNVRTVSEHRLNRGMHQYTELRCLVQPSRRKPVLFIIEIVCSIHLCLVARVAASMLSIVRSSRR